MSLNDENNIASGLTPVTSEAPRQEVVAAHPELHLQLLSALMEKPAEEPPSIDFGFIGRALRRFWPVLIASTALCLGGAYYYLTKTPTLYLALGEIGVGQERNELLPSSAMRGEDLKSLEMLKSIERQIAGQNVLMEVARRFNLHHDPVLAGPLAAVGLADDQVVGALAKRVTASLERGTRNIVVSVEDTDPQRAKDICQAILDHVVQRDPHTASALKDKAISALEHQVNEARKRVDASQVSVNAFRAKYPGLPLEETPSDMKTNSFEDRLKALHADAIKAEEELSTMEVLMDRINGAGSNINGLLAVPGLGTQEAVIAQRKALAAAQATFAETDYGPRHPGYRAMNQQLSEIAGGLLQTLLTSAKVERARYEKAKGNLERIETQLAALKQQQNNFAVVAGDFQKLARELKSARDGYSAVLGRLNEEKTNSGFGASALSVVSDPLVPSSPWKPRRLLILGAGGVAGIGGGVALVALLMLLDRSIRSIAGGERLLNLPCLAAVPRVKMIVGKGQLIYGRDQDSPAAEAFRGMRAALGTSGRSSGARSFLFTSARSVEGKSTVAMNFAASLAQQGYRTLIIDANLRTPVMDSVFLGERAPTGLADYLSGECAPDAKLCQPTDLANLFLFSAGIPKAHPGEILGEPAFARLLKESLKWFHRVVIDTPAVGQYADALPLARHADAVCLVVRPGLTRKGQALKTLNRLTSAGARPVGFVLNAAPEVAVKEGFAGEYAASFQSAQMLPALPPARA